MPQQLNLPSRKTVISRAIQGGATLALASGKYLSAAGIIYYNTESGLNMLDVNNELIIGVTAASGIFLSLLVISFSQIPSIWKKTHPKRFIEIPKKFYKKKNQKQISAGLVISGFGLFKSVSIGLGAVLGGGRVITLLGEIALLLGVHDSNQVLDNKFLQGLLLLLIGAGSFASFFFYNIIDNAVKYAHELFDDQTSVRTVLSKIKEAKLFVFTSLILILNSGFTAYFVSDKVQKNTFHNKIPLFVFAPMVVVLVISSMVTSLFTRVAKLLDKNPTASKKSYRWLVPMFYIANLEAVSSGVGKLIHIFYFENETFGATLSFSPWWCLPLLGITLVYASISGLAERKARNEFTGKKALDQSLGARFFSCRAERTNGDAEARARVVNQETPLLPDTETPEHNAVNTL